ncbi:MAG: S8 family serine peptidase [Lautropia sp.]|nr:S8 family serine peptidase [Lautropia sp.]
MSGAQPEGKPEVLERSASVDGASWRIGVVDSGFSSTQQDRVEAARAFVLDEAGQVRQEPVGPDCLCHGSAMLAVMAEAVPEARFCVAQVFGRTGSTSSAQIAMAIDWLRDCGVRLINLSLGVRQDYPGLAQACARARAAGVILVAASPPRGEPVFPAAYPGVLAATGDGRCQPGQWSWLDHAIGAPVRLPGHGPAGASMACAIVSAEAARWLFRHPGADLAALCRHFRGKATYRR